MLRSFIMLCSYAASANGSAIRVFVTSLQVLYTTSTNQY